MGSLATLIGVLACSAAPALAAPQWLLPPSVVIGPDSVGEACTNTPCPPFPLFYSGGYEPQFHVYMGPTGGAVALMVSSDDKSLLAETRPAGGTFGPPQTLDPSSFANPQVPEFQVAFDRQGNAFVVWTSQGTGNLVVDEASAPPGGTFSLPRVISVGSAVATEPRLAVSPRGDVTVTWIESGGGHADSGERPPGGPALREADEAQSQAPALHPAGRAREVRAPRQGRQEHAPVHGSGSPSRPSPSLLRAGGGAARRERNRPRGEPQVPDQTALTPCDRSAARNR